ncbi:MAG: hypothetical protein LUI02_06270, partial [Clostridiales bacterium]|nr:hypothetical protein [Clostridiales bacterium]
MEKKNIAVVHTHGNGAEADTFKTEVLALLPDTKEGEAKALAILKSKEAERKAEGRYTNLNEAKKWLYVGTYDDCDGGPDFGIWDSYDAYSEPQAVNIGDRAALGTLVDGLTGCKDLPEEYRWLVKCNPANLTELREIFLGCEDAGKSWAGALQVLLHRLYARALPFDTAVGD